MSIKITVSNYKCFDKTGGEIVDIKPINIIIGRNNSGKSSVIELIEYLTNGTKEFNLRGRNDENPKVIIDEKLEGTSLKKLLDPFRVGSNALSSLSLNYKLNEPPQRNYYISHRFNGRVALNGARISDILSYNNSPLNGLIFRRIASERNIISEVRSKNNLEYKPNGDGITNFFVELINNAKYPRKLIEETLLESLNSIVNPEIYFKRILVEDYENGDWEIIFQNNEGDNIQLTKMGSGIKTIIMVLLELVVRPILREIEISDCVFAFEELENNLHPAMQTKLYRFIKEFQLNNGGHYFLTTHSNVVIDCFSQEDNVQYLHVLTEEGRTKIKTIKSNRETRHLLNDLGIKASSILQANGVIWVEGPSDRVYINKWLEQKGVKYKEGVHFTYVFYGGSLLANYTFDDENDDDKLMELLKVNQNSFVVMDSDKKDKDSDLKPRVKSIKSELSEDNIWITEGREIENYLLDEQIIKWRNDKKIAAEGFKLGKYDNLTKIVNKENETSIDYSKNKSKYSRQIVECFSDKFNPKYDLEVQLNKLHDRIKEWNLE